MMSRRTKVVLLGTLLIPISYAVLSRALFLNFAALILFAIGFLFALLLPFSLIRDFASRERSF